MIVLSSPAVNAAPTVTGVGRRAPVPHDGKEWKP